MSPSINRSKLPTTFLLVVHSSQSQSLRVALFQTMSVPAEIIKQRASMETDSELGELNRPSSIGTSAFGTGDWSTSVDAKFASIDAKFTAVDAKFAAVDARFAAVDARFAAVDARFAAVESRLAAVESRLAAVESRLAAVEFRLDRIEMDMRHMETRLRSDMLQMQENILAGLQEMITAAMAARGQSPAPRGPPPSPSPIIFANQSHSDSSGSGSMVPNIVVSGDEEVLPEPISSDLASMHSSSSRLSGFAKRTGDTLHRAGSRFLKAASPKGTSKSAEN
ncbi:hypothetical protein B0H21DRAFT_706025 [Amylocystis lapponica]|nr:hypothetical protein B0H21DRAFT_706025 [Amylocystis lapponica]